MTIDQNNVSVLDVSPEGVRELKGDEKKAAIEEDGIAALFEKEEQTPVDGRYKALTYAIESKLATDVDELIYIAARIQLFAEKGEPMITQIAAGTAVEWERLRKMVKGKTPAKKAAKKAAPKKAVKKVVKKAGVKRAYQKRLK